MKKQLQELSDRLDMSIIRSLKRHETLTNDINKIRQEIDNILKIKKPAFGAGGGNSVVITKEDKFSESLGAFSRSCNGVLKPINNRIYWSVGYPTDHEFNSKQEAIDYCQDCLNDEENQDYEDFKLIKYDFENCKVLEEIEISLEKEEGCDPYKEHNTMHNLI